MSTLIPLVSSAAYGVSDYLGGVASRRSSALRVVAVSYPTSVIGCGVLAPFVPGEPTGAGLWWGTGAGAVTAVAIWWFYMAMAAGPISFVSPVTAVLVAAVPVAIGLFQGERPPLLAWLGIVLGLVAVILVSRTSARAGRRRIAPRTMVLTLAAGVAFALGFVLTAKIPTGSGLAPIVAGRVAATAVVYAFLIPYEMRSERGQKQQTYLVPVLVGIVDVIANVTMYYTFQYGELALGSIIIALYPAFTVGLAVLLLRERIGAAQSLGLATAAASVLLVSCATAT